MMPVHISSQALIEIKEILEKKNIPVGYGLRIGVKGGRGCAGVNFVLGFDKPKDDDTIYEVEGVRVFVQKRQMMYLIGKKIEFYEGADARGFVFEDQDQPDSSTIAR